MQNAIAWKIGKVLSDQAQILQALRQGYNGQIKKKDSSVRPMGTKIQPVPF